MILNNDICRVYTDFPKTGHIYVCMCVYAMFVLLYVSVYVHTHAITIVRFQNTYILFIRM